MKIITRYLLQDLLKPTFVALFVMISVIWLMQSLRFMDFIINRGLDVQDFVMLTILLVPSLLVVVLPIAFFIGVCFAMKRLIDDSELDALFAGGLTRRQIVNPALIAASIICSIGYINVFWALPLSKGHFKDIQHQLRSTQSVLLLEEGTFNQVTPQLTVFMKSRTPDGTLKNLLVHETTNPAQPVTWVAEEGQIVRTRDGRPQLVLTNAARLEVSNDRLFTLAFARSTIDLQTNFQAAAPRWREADERTLFELLDRKDVPAHDANRFNAEIARRLLWPLSPLPMVLIAGLILIRAQKRRDAGTVGLGMAGLGALTYQATLAGTHSLAMQGVVPVLVGQALLPALVIVICLYLLGEGRRRPA